jgi:hypothetical protein
MRIIALTFFFIYMTFRERVFYFAGPLAIPILEPLFLLFTCVAVAPKLNQILPSLGPHFSSWTPYLTLGFILPLLGVIMGDYDISSLYLIFTSVLCPLAAISLGTLTVTHVSGQHDMKKVTALINSTLILQSGMVALQVLRQFGFSNILIELQTEWDVTSQLQLSDDYVILGRPIGSFINPNVLGVWALVCFYWNLVLSQGYIRNIFCALSLIIIMTSQSRGTVAALCLSAALFLFNILKRGMFESRIKVLQNLALVFGLAIIGSLFLLFATYQADQILGAGRWSQGWKVLFEGAEADANFSGRIGVWREVLPFMSEHPLGTFGPPQVLFILPVDNLFLYCLLQGSIFYIFALLFGFAYSTAHIGSSYRINTLLAIIAFALAINSITATPLHYTAALLYWFLIGAQLNYLYSEKTMAEVAPA